MGVTPCGFYYSSVVAAHSAVVSCRKERDEVAIGVQVEAIHRHFVRTDDHFEAVPKCDQWGREQSSSHTVTHSADGGMRQQAILQVDAWAAWKLPSQEAAHNPLVERAYTLSSCAFADTHMVGDHSCLVFLVGAMFPLA